MLTFTTDTDNLDKYKHLSQQMDITLLWQEIQPIDDGIMMISVDCECVSHMSKFLFNCFKIDNDLIVQSFI